MRIILLNPLRQPSENNSQSIPAINTRESLFRFKHQHDSWQIRLHVFFSRCQLQQRHRLIEVPLATFQAVFQRSIGAPFNASKHPLSPEPRRQITQDVAYQKTNHSSNDETDDVKVFETHRSTHHKPESTRDQVQHDE